MDQNLRNLERQAVAGNSVASERLLRERARAGETVAQRMVRLLDGDSPVSNFASRLIERSRIGGGGMKHRVFFAASFPGGASLSVQAGEAQYSSPRRVLPLGDHSYTEWELGAVPSNLPREVAEMASWEGGYNADTEEYESGPDYDSFTVAGWVDTAVVQDMLDGMFVAFGEPTFDGSNPDGPDGEPEDDSWIRLAEGTLVADSATESPAESEESEPENVVEFSENNSGGSYWLSRADYEALAEAGWEMGRTSYDGSIRGATRRGLSDDAAIAEWERITGQDSEAEGCECCGPPFYFD